MMLAKRKNKTIKITILIFLIIFCIFAVWRGNVTVGVTYFKIDSESIPAAFSGYRIAQVSDLHNAELGKNNSRVIRLLRQEEPDIIVITGDLVDSNHPDIDIAAEFAARAIKIAPCYYVTGNHEAWLGKQYEELEERLKDMGVTVLHDESVELTENGAVIRLVGLDDPDFAPADVLTGERLDKIKREYLNPEGEFTILLSHRPELFEEYVSADMDLVFCGHAHGGQFRIPFVGGLIAPNQGLFPEYDAGMYRKEKTVMLVSRGIGNSIIPVRINNRPEVIIAELE